MRSNDKTHQPVMLEEVTKFLSPKDNMVYVDGTFGSGGYSKRILELATVSYTHLTLPTKA